MKIFYFFEFNRKIPDQKKKFLDIFFKHFIFMIELFHDQLAVQKTFEGHFFAFGLSEDELHLLQGKNERLILSFIVGCISDKFPIRFPAATCFNDNAHCRRPGIASRGAVRENFYFVHIKFQLMRLSFLISTIFISILWFPFHSFDRRLQTTETLFPTRKSGKSFPPLKNIPSKYFFSESLELKTNFKCFCPFPT